MEATTTPTLTRSTYDVTKPVATSSTHSDVFTLQMELTQLSDGEDATQLFETETGLTTDEYDIDEETM